MSEAIFQRVLQQVHAQDQLNKWANSTYGLIRDMSLNGRGDAGELYFSTICAQTPGLVGFTSFDDPLLVPPHGEYDGLLASDVHYSSLCQPAPSDFINFEIKTISEDAAGSFQVNNISPSHSWDYLLVFHVFPNQIGYSIIPHSDVNGMTLTPMKGGSSGCYKLHLRSPFEPSLSTFASTLMLLCQQEGF